MKKMYKVLMAVIIAMLFCDATMAQLSVKNTGFTHVKLGTGYGGYNNEIIFDNSGYYNYGTIRPKDNTKGNLGTSTKAWYRIYYSSLIKVSDARKKENIQPINSAYQRILALNGVRYSYLNDANKEMHYGFLAQEVKSLIPEMVIYDEKTDVYGIDYTALTPILVEAFKEQSKLIEDLKLEIHMLNILINELQEKSSLNTEQFSEAAIQMNQNQPNPFSEATEISFYIPNSVNNATLCIYDLSGKQLSESNLTQRGDVVYTIEGGRLEAGLYLYSLIADGKVAGTKRMVLSTH